MLNEEITQNGVKVNIFLKFQINLDIISRGSIYFIH